MSPPDSASDEGRITQAPVKQAVVNGCFLLVANLVQQVLRYFAEGIRELCGYTTTSPINAQDSDTKRVALTWPHGGGGGGELSLGGSKQCLRKACKTLKAAGLGQVTCNCYEAISLVDSGPRGGARKVAPAKLCHYRVGAPDRHTAALESFSAHGFTNTHAASFASLNPSFSRLYMHVDYST